ncbi:WD40-repeat-containing domain protein [Pisolithus albus]|nr:WD40-repeat-containing domain protein [Pisolithus albus]
MLLQYVEKWSQLGLHNDSIDSLAFSHDGRFLASASVDGNVAISKGEDGTLLHLIRCQTPVLSLRWVRGRTHELWCGLGNGKVLRVVITKEKLEISCFTIHDYPIEHLAFDSTGTYLATGAHPELKVFRYIASVTVAPNLSIVVTSIHWLHKGRDANCLVVTYLHHGIICWDPFSATYRWTMPLGTLIGHTDLHPDETRIAVMNQHNGVDIWQVPAAILDCSLPLPIRKGVLLPVLWIDNGLRILTGSDFGEVRVWNPTTGKSLYPLPHPTGNAETMGKIAVRVFETRELHIPDPGLGELEQTMLHRFCMGQHLCTLMSSEFLPSNATSLLVNFDRIFRTSLRDRQMRQTKLPMQMISNRCQKIITASFMTGF